MPFKLSGLTAAVAPAAEGVGPAVVAALATEGVRVAVDAAPPQASAVEVVGAVGDDPAGFIERCEAAVGPLDILVVSAGVVRNKPLFEISAAELRDVVEQELNRPALLIQAAARRMAARRRGRIVVFASMSGKTGAHHNVAPFAAAKGGLLAFVRATASEVAAHGVTVNAIATALFEPQTATMAEAKRERLRGEVPVGRFGRVEEAAHAVLFLVDPDAAYMTGECLNLSGGRFMD